MRSFFEWFRESGGGPDRPWLILGKGPSFARHREFDLSAYRLLSLNHVVRELPVEVAHVIDADVIDACADKLPGHCRVLAMPWRPHVGNRPGKLTLEEHAARNPTLGRLAAEGRLLWYNASTAGPEAGPESGAHREGSPIVRVVFFSVEAALNLLVEAGVRRVRTLGIDGGAEYSGAFADLKDATLLNNRRTSFNRQFEQIAATILRTGVDFAPLDAESPIRVFVATTDAQMLATRVLEFSIRRHASMSVEVAPLHRAGIEVPTPADERNRPRTPFSFQRFLIPEARGYRGRAIYLDSDMLVFDDLRKLWALPLDEAPLLAAYEPSGTGRKPQFSVMLLDCAALKWDIREIVRRLDAGELDYGRLMHDMAVAPKVAAVIEPRWNSLERYAEGETGLLHYTDMDTQPWVFAGNPLGYLWARALFQALDAGFLTRAEVEGHVRRGWVRPSLLYQIDHRVEDGVLLPRAARDADKDFVAPYRSLRGSTRFARSPLAVAAALARRAYEATPLPRVRRALRDFRGTGDSGGAGGPRVKP